MHNFQLSRLLLAGHIDKGETAIVPPYFMGPSLTSHTFGWTATL